MTLNHTAQLRMAMAATKLMFNGGRIVFVTSHWAHFYGKKPVISDYEAVAKSKYAGEQALREYVSELNGCGISLLVISGDIIEGTITHDCWSANVHGSLNIADRKLTSCPP